MSAGAYLHDSGLSNGAEAVRKGPRNLGVWQTAKGPTEEKDRGKVRQEDKRKAANGCMAGRRVACVCDLLVCVRIGLFPLLEP